MDIGLDQVSGNKLVHINAPRDFLTSGITFCPATGVRGY